MGVLAERDLIPRNRMRPERRLVIRGASWDDYLVLTDSLDPRSVLRVAYDGKDIEIMTKGGDHERLSFLIAQIVVVAAQARGVHVEPFGETTWRNQDVKRGIEADQWFFFAADKRKQIAAIKRADRASGRRENDTQDLPVPDLAIEIDVSPPQIDRQDIYAALGVPELWRFDGEAAAIERRTPERRYEPAGESAWLGLTPVDLVRWLVREDTSEFIPWLNRVTRWARRKFAGKRT